MDMSKLKFKVGDKINYILAGNIFLTGIITAVRPSKTEKTYTFDSGGKLYFSDGKFLQPCAS